MHVFGCGRKLEYPNPYSYTERPQPAGGFEPRTLLLWDYSANHCTTVLPYQKCVHSHGFWIIWKNNHHKYCKQVALQNNLNADCHIELWISQQWSFFTLTGEFVFLFTDLAIHPPIHPSIADAYLCLRSPGFPLSSYLFQLCWWDTTGFPGQVRDVIPPGPPLIPPLTWTCHFTFEASSRHPGSFSCGGVASLSYSPHL